MKKKMPKSLKAVIIAVVVLFMIAICYFAVSLYIKYDVNKPKFQAPEEEPLASVVELPKTKEEALEYAKQLVEGAFIAGAEVKSRSKVSISGDFLNDSFEHADAEVLSLVKDSAEPQIAELYESYPYTPGNEVENIPKLLSLKASDILDFTAEEGSTENGEEGAEENEEDEKDRDPDSSKFYFITLTVAADKLNNAELGIATEETVASAIKDKLSSALDVNNFDATPEEYYIRLKVNRLHNTLRKLVIGRKYDVDASVSFKDLYSGLGEKDLSFGYSAKTILRFKFYNAEFTKRNVYIQKKDIQALPLSVTVNEKAILHEDFELEFTVSDENIATVDEDGVLTAREASEEPITVTMTLEYEGFVFTDTILVTVTELEVE